MSLTNYKANMGWMKYKSVGIGNYRDILPTRTFGGDADNGALRLLVHLL